MSHYYQKFIDLNVTKLSDLLSSPDKVEKAITDPTDLARMNQEIAQYHDDEKLVNEVTNLIWFALIWILKIIH